MIFLRAFLAMGMIVFGFVIYPYYIDYFITPVIAIANTLNPSMNVLEEFYLAVLPLIILLMILFFGIMSMLGKVGIGRSFEP